jgi:nucleotide-binding universal stress UspA family protein
MRDINKILTVIDDSKLSRDILKKSIELADKFDASIIVLYTIHIPFFNLPIYNRDVPVDKERVKDSIDKMFSKLNEKEVKHHTLVYFGDNSERAIIEAKRDAVDMIVTCDNIKYEKLIREAQKPMLIVKREYKEYKDILIPTDLTEKSKKSIEFIRDSFDAKFALVYGYESVTATMSMYDISYVDMVEYQGQNRDIAQKLLSEFEKEVGVEGELTDSSFSLPNGVLEYIEEKKPDLVTVASHSSEESFFVGSMSSYLAKESPCDILIFC